jgi:hypothetical protein
MASTKHQINDQFLLRVDRKQEESKNAVVIQCTCGDSYVLSFAPQHSAETVRLGRGGLKNLFQWYKSKYPPPAQGTIVIWRKSDGFDISPPDLNTLEDFEKQFKKALQEFAAKYCSPLAREKYIFCDGMHEGSVKITSKFCVLKIDIYIAVAVHNLMTDDDYEDLLDQLKKQTKEYEDYKVQVQRGGKTVNDVVTARRLSSGRLIIYLDVGYADYRFQTGWTESSDLRPCREHKKKKKHSDIEEKPKRPNEEEEKD